MLQDMMSEGASPMDEDIETESDTQSADVSMASCSSEEHHQSIGIQVSCEVRLCKTLECLLGNPCSYTLL